MEHSISMASEAASPGVESPDRRAEPGADSEAFERLTMPHLTDVARFARSLTRDPVRADDLVQETYLQALRGWHTFHAGADPRRWLFAICHNAFLRTVRTEARYVDAPDDDAEIESLATATAHWQAQKNGLAERVDRMDLGAAIDHALGTLPEHFRTVITLVDVEGLSYEESAMVLGVPIGTVRSRLFRGRRLLQDQLFVYAQDAGFTTARSPIAFPARPGTPVDPAA
jgi:RNA polymerase sigma-70 factor (ECF subfamily)